MYSGTFVTLAKSELSNKQNANINKWSAYISGSVDRQDYLARGLDWVSSGNIGEYMSQHRSDTNINELKTYFSTVIDWVSSVFENVESEMKGLEWARLYRQYHNKAYNPEQVSSKVKELYGDSNIKNRKGVFEYILGGCVDTKLLEIRLFDDSTKKSIYTLQIEKAKVEGISNCPLCAMGSDSNQTKIWNLSEMDADHVTAWSKGGSTTANNCQMLCKTHNRAKGNK